VSEKNSMGEDDKGFAAPGSFPPTQPAESENPGAGRAAGETDPDAPPPASQLGGWAGFGAGPNPYQGAPGPQQGASNPYQSPYVQQTDDPRGSQPYAQGPYAQPYGPSPQSPYGPSSHPQSPHAQSPPPQPPYSQAARSGPGGHAPGLYGPDPQSSRSKDGRRGVPVLVLIALTLIAGLVGGAVGAFFVPGSGSEPVALPPPTPTGEDGESLAGSVTSVADAVLPSVVSIDTGASSGSGFAVRTDGYLLTNHHVIANADGQLTVTFADGRKEEAEVVGSTVSYDLAVLKVDRDDLVPLELADSEAVEVGEQVVAIGAPLGLDGTVTTGIVSALNRPVAAGDEIDTAFINAIQTDTAINPGNSGGPLVNMSGQVVGIASAIAQVPGSSGSIGLGFAIPASQARRTADQLMETGKATYPIVGVLLDNRYNGEGVQVLEDDTADMEAVTPGGPAEEAGIEPGDVILAIDGRPVTQPDELIVAIRAKAPGDEIELTIRPRDGSDETEVSITLDETESE